MSRYAQGLLTYCLLKVIKQQPDILEDKKYLNINRWVDAAEKTVNELAEQTGVRQQPQKIGISNFNVGIVDDEILAAIKLANEKPLFARSDFRNTASISDNLKLRVLIDKELNSISNRGMDNTVTYSAEYEGADAYALTGDYKVDDSNITVSVMLTRGITEIRYKFEIKGTTDQLQKLAENIAVKGVEWVSQNK